MLVGQSAGAFTPPVWVVVFFISVNMRHRMCEEGLSAWENASQTRILLLRVYHSRCHWNSFDVLSVFCFVFQASDKKADTDIFRKFPRKASILNMPIITTLYYSCFYHYGEPEVQAHDSLLCYEDGLFTECVTIDTVLKCYIVLHYK